MPQVPDIKLPTVAPTGAGTPYLSVGATPEQFGAGTARAAQELGGTVEQAAVKFQQVRNETVADDTYTNKFSPAFREKYQQYYALQGKDALDQLPQYMKDMDKIAQDHAASLENPLQKHLFNQMARRRVQAELDGMARYADQQNKVWMASTSDSFLKNQLDQAADFHNDEQKFGAALGAGLGEIDRYGARTGQSAEVIKDRANKFVSAAWVNRIQRAVLDNPIEGRKLYEANINEVDAAARPQLEHAIKQAVWPVEARNIADQAIRDIPQRSIDIRANLGKWTEEVEKKAEETHPGNPVFRDLAISRLHSYVNTYATAQQGIERQARNILTTSALTPGADGAKPTTVEELLSSPQAKVAWANMDGYSQTAVLGLLEHNQRKSDPPLTDNAMQTYYRLKGTATRDPEEFLNLNLLEYSKAIPHGLFHELVNQQAAMGRKDVRDQEKALNVQHALAIARPAMLAAGVFDPKAKPGSSKAQLYDQFVGRFTQQIDQYVNNNKKRPGDKDLQDMANSLLTQGAAAGTGWFYDDKTRAFQVPASQFYVPVPKGERAKIADEWKRLRGNDPTDAQVQQVYTLKTLQKGSK